MRTIVLALVSVLIAGHAWAEESVIDKLRNTPASMQDVGEIRMFLGLEETKGYWKAFSSYPSIQPFRNDLGGISFNVNISPKAVSASFVCEEVTKGMKMFIGNWGDPDGKDINGMVLRYKKMGGYFASASDTPDYIEAIGERLTRGSSVNVYITGDKEVCTRDLNAPYRP